MSEESRALTIWRDPSEPTPSLSSLAPAAESSEGLWNGSEWLDLLSSMRGVVYYLPREEHGRAQALFEFLRGAPGSIVSSQAAQRLRYVGLELLKSLRSAVSLSRRTSRTSEPGGELEVVLQEEEGGLSHDQTQQLIIQLLHSKEQRLKGTLKIIQQCATQFDDGDDLFLSLLPVLEELEPSDQGKVVSAFSTRWPKAIGPRLFVSGHERRTEDFAAETYHRLQGTSEQNISTPQLILCAALGSPYVLERILRDSIRIDDVKEQASACFGLMPYLPKNAANGELSDLLDEKLAGREIACFAGIMVELTKALSADALSEMVLAATEHYSEWWVVETLTVIGQRATTSAEIMSVCRASLLLRHRDLQARILGRLALRAVDVADAQLATQIARSIELATARWQEFRLIAVRLVTAGSTDAALQVAAAIEDTDERSRAYAETALELGAQGKIGLARSLIREKVATDVWRNWAEELLRPAAAAEFEDSTDQLAARIRLRKENVDSVDRFRAVENCVAVLKREGVDDRFFCEVNGAIKRRDAAALEAAISDLWKNEWDAEAPFWDVVLSGKRPAVFLKIGQIAPLFPDGARERMAGEVFSAVRRVVGWWP